MLKINVFEVTIPLCQHAINKCIYHLIVKRMPNIYLFNKISNKV